MWSVAAAIDETMVVSLMGETWSPKTPPASAAATKGESGSPITAPVDYLNSAAKAKQSMEKTVDVTSINKAIELFNAQEGRFPENLDELVTKKYLAQIPTPPFGTKIEYDSKTGAAKIVKQ